MGCCRCWCSGRFEVRIVERVRPGAFVPAPQVDSVVVHLQARATALVPPGPADAQLVAAARAAFSARRKTLRNALMGSLGLGADAALAALADAALDPAARAERLDLPAFARLGAALAQRGLLPAVGA